MTKLSKIISDLESKSRISFSDFSDYCDNLQKKGEFDQLNNAMSKKFGYDWYNFPNITFADYKQRLYAGFRSNSTLNMSLPTRPNSGIEKRPSITGSKLAERPYHNKVAVISDVSIPPFVVANGIWVDINIWQDGGTWVD